LQDLAGRNYSNNKTIATSLNKKAAWDQIPGGFLFALSPEFRVVSFTTYF
jgi:hypothetical protein